MELQYFIWGDRREAEYSGGVARVLEAVSNERIKDL